MKNSKESGPRQMLVALLGIMVFLTVCATDEFVKKKTEAEPAAEELIRL